MHYRRNHDLIPQSYGEIRGLYISITPVPL